MTVTLDEGTARWVRVEAAKRDISVSQYLRDVLAAQRRLTDGYLESQRTFLSRQARPLRGEGQRLPTRAELHERDLRG